MLATPAKPADPGPGCTPELYRQVMGCFPTGVTVMTVSLPDGSRAGVTASSFNTVSMDPPLILWSLALKAPSLAAFRAADHFAVNVLAEAQHGLALQFARPSEDKFAGVGLVAGVTGAPLIAGALAHIECRITQRYAGGDHEIMLGEVIALSRDEGEPLVFRGGRFHRLTPH
ncbi:flavin reductase family protein [Neotabrizicola sp. VNH66]|uniref:flavin reductase family protein n=1 Tax=Neotabrizicola sp. VNH66 TaxID=3400918 RepID=UPI003C0B201D